MYFSGLITHLQTLLENEDLCFVFQPIFDLHRREVLGYETLMRGPTDSPLHMPEQLLRVARNAGLGIKLEWMSTRLALEAFTTAALPGRLFVNLSAAMIAEQVRGDGLCRLVKLSGFERERLVLERHGDEDVAGLDVALGILAECGFGFASDRLGLAAGQPDFVKLSPALIRQIHADPQRQAELAIFLRQAAADGVQTIAEGVEDARELATLRDLGCDHAQGFLLGRPSADPARQLSRGVAGILSARAAFALPVGVIQSALPFSRFLP